MGTFAFPKIPFLAVPRSESPRSTIGNARLCGVPAQSASSGSWPKRCQTSRRLSPKPECDGSCFVAPGALRAAERHDAGEVVRRERGDDRICFEMEVGGPASLFPIPAKRLFPPAAIQPGFTLLYWKESCAPGWLAAFSW
jgi:hypothetical protein